jgi:dihydropteroate synthase
LQALLTKISLNCRGRLISLLDPKVMGILNITPDSFFDQSRVESTSKQLDKVEEMLLNGANFIDIGGQSTRPGAEMVGVDVELSRVIPAIKAIVNTFPEAILSIDTFNSEVAKQAINEGASIVNDVSAGDDDANMFRVIADLKVPYIMMHKKGQSKNMQENPTYENILLEVSNYFSKKLCDLAALGVYDIILDPGFGFGKNLNHNYQLLNHLNDLSLFELPVLVGMSRKQMVQKVISVNAENALNGTTAVHMVALSNGAKILRVHDVKEAVECIKIYKALNAQKLG